MLYPLLFEPILKERMWGGEKISKTFKRKSTSANIGESWNLACHKNGTSIVSNGEHRGKALDLLIKEYGRELMGNKLDESFLDKFPLLIKFLDASKTLSLQVHPKDQYALIHENGELGKTEMWYIVEARPGAFIYYGINDGVSPEEFRSAVSRGKIEPYLSKLDVQKGDVIYIPSGMVHAVGPGILICEVQQNSDTTYRVFDWNREDKDGNRRELHIEKALEVIDFKGRFPKGKTRGVRLREAGGYRTYYVVSPYFIVSKLQIEESMAGLAEGDRFYILTVVEGDGYIRYGEESQPFNAGDSIMIPASLGRYTIFGKATLLETYMPDKESQNLQWLKDEGIHPEDITAIAGLENM